MKKVKNGNACAKLVHESDCGNQGHDQEGLYIVDLAELPANTLLDNQALAEVFSVSTRTLRRMVGRGEIPRGIRLGGRSMWIAGTLVEYLKAEAERQAAQARRLAANMSCVRG
jgi:predicted DNA-binding transcriptional regulator AlpA